MLSTIKLFKALPVGDHNAMQGDEGLNRRTLERGFVFAPEIVAQYPDWDKIIDQVNRAYGRGSEELNQAFHKSFAKVRDASMHQLYFEQVVHYFTTYGAENLGIYNEESVFIPRERLGAPELGEGVRVVVIRALTKEELKAELLKLLASGVALKEDTIKDALDVATFVGIVEADLAEIANKEAKAALYDYLGIVPEKPLEFLRYAIFRATGKTLLIKNKATVELIKGSQNVGVVRLFQIYEEKYGLAQLAEVFYRYKPLFLAFRTNTQLKKTINKIRRLAKVNHKPMREDLLNNITARLSHKEAPDLKALNAAIKDASIFRKARLAYALRFRMTDADSIVYRVRNGKTYVKDFSFANKKGAEIVYDAIFQSIVDDVAKNVAGKKFFIPKGVVYGLPATEKQFTGNLPTGTYVGVTEDTIFGVHWENVGRHRIDLDLSVQDAAGKIGWDARYRSGSIYFSGDITDAPAPNGATEVFHIGGQERGAWLVNLNYFNYDEKVPVPYKLFVGSAHREEVDRNYVVDPNKLALVMPTQIDKHHQTIGLVTSTYQYTRFFFAEFNNDKLISARNDERSEKVRKWLFNNTITPISLNGIMQLAGAEFVEEMAEGVIDLSPEALDKSTIINLLVGEK